MKRTKQLLALLLSAVLMLTVLLLPVSAASVGDTVLYNHYLFSMVSEKKDEKVKIAGRLKLGDNKTDAKDYDNGYLFTAPDTGFYAFDSICSYLDCSEPIIGQYEIQMYWGYSPWDTIESDSHSLIVYLNKDEEVMITAWGWPELANKTVQAVALGSVTDITPPDLSRPYIIDTETKQAAPLTYYFRAAGNKEVYWTVRFQNGDYGVAELAFTTDSALQVGTQTIHVNQYGLKREFTARFTSLSALISSIQLPSGFRPLATITKRADGAETLERAAFPSWIDVTFANGSRTSVPVQVNTGALTTTVPIVCPDGRTLNLNLYYSNYNTAILHTVEGQWKLVMQFAGESGRFAEFASDIEYYSKPDPEPEPSMGFFGRILNALRNILRWFIGLPGRIFSRLGA